MAHLSLLLALLLSLSAASSATKFTVGDAKAWNPNVNYTTWVDKHKPFYVGDWLVFYYTSGMADVVQVDEAAYNKCDSSHPISNYSKGRSYAFELNHSRTYYFICSFGYCYQGMEARHQGPAAASPVAATVGQALRRRRHCSVVFRRRPLRCFSSDSVDVVVCGSS